MGEKDLNRIDIKKRDGFDAIIRIIDMTFLQETHVAHVH